MYICEEANVAYAQHIVRWKSLQLRLYINGNNIVLYLEASVIEIKRKYSPQTYYSENCPEFQLSPVVNKRLNAIFYFTDSCTQG